MALASAFVLAYRHLHAIEIQHMGGGLFAPLPDRRRIRRRAQGRTELKPSLVTAVALVIITAPANTAPIERAADSIECKGIIARLIEATNTNLDHYSPSGDNVFLKGPDMVLSCTSHRLTGVSLSWDASGFPPNSWFGLLAKAGKAVTGVDLKKLEFATRQCHRSALKDKTELADLDIPNAKIECQAFTRDGGGVNISIWMNDHEARKGIEEP